LFGNLTFFFGFSWFDLGCSSLKVEKFEFKLKNRDFLFQLFDVNFDTWEKQVEISHFMLGFLHSKQKFRYDFHVFLVSRRPVLTQKWVIPVFFNAEGAEVRKGRKFQGNVSQQIPRFPHRYSGQTTPRAAALKNKTKMQSFCPQMAQMFADLI